MIQGVSKITSTMVASADRSLKSTFLETPCIMGFRYCLVRYMKKNMKTPFVGRHSRKFPNGLEVKRLKPQQYDLSFNYVTRD